MRYREKSKVHSIWIVLNHNIEAFDDYMDQTGIKERLLNENPEESLQAIYDLLDINLGDLHSGYLYPTYLAGTDHRVAALCLVLSGLFPWIRQKPRSRSR